MRARERAEAEWARVQERPTLGNRVERFNDVALEAAIAAARLGSLAGASGLAVLLPLAAVVGEVRYWFAVLLWAAIVLGIGWWGWWYYGNADWRRRRGNATDAGN